MKGILGIAGMIITLMSCGNANDGNAATDTTNFSKPMDTGPLSGAYGDTGINMDPTMNTDTTSRPYSGAGSDTAASAGDNSAASGTGGNQ